MLTMDPDLGLVVELLAHFDAGDRHQWAGNQDSRPLSELGRRQAQRIAAELSMTPINELLSSPAIRCVQSLNPLAELSGLSISICDSLRETHGFQPPPGWNEVAGSSESDPIGGAYAAGRCHTLLMEAIEIHPRGRVVICSHGDVVPATIAFLAGAHGIDVPPPEQRRGGWFTIYFAGDHVSIKRNQRLTDFPV